MSLNMKSLTQALAKTAAVIEKTVQSTVHEVTGPKPMQDYELQEQIGSAGPALAWKLYAATPRSKTPQQHQEVCVWVVDKKAVGEARQHSGLPKASEEAFLDILRSDAAKLARLRHPGVVQVVQGLDESKAAMAMVTEPIFACLANLLNQIDNLPSLPKHLKDLELGQLEIKHGLLQLSESLNFLHNNARTIHSAVSPESVFITASGAWKLGGFGFATSIDQMTSEIPRGPTFHYPEYDADDALLPLQPPLNYTAPELTRRNGSATRTSADTFSLACLAYCLLAKRPLIESNNNLKTYTRKLMYLTNEDFVNIPPDLVPDMRRMLNMDEMSRPSVLDFTGSSFFRDDTRLRALRFLDHMLERDNMQKSEFLKALTGMWTEFDARVLRYRVLPPLCAELRNVVLQSMVLPMVLTIAEAQDKSDFESSTFPALVPVLTTASGDSLLLLVKHAALLINKVGPEQLTSCVLPMLVRAYDDTDARMQEEVLRRTLSIAKILDFQVLREAILPRLHNLALRTTVAAVRVNALLCFAELVQRLDKEAVLEILQTIQRCTAVDHSAPTLMCTLDVANAINKQYGVEFSAQRLVPLLSPLLVTQQLNVQQFAKYMHFIKEILRQIEEKRGITANGDGSTSVDLKLQNTLVNETTKTVSRKESSNTMLSLGGASSGNGNGNGNSSWDSDDVDWAAIAKSQKVSATDVASVSNIGPGTQQVSSILGNGPSNSGATVASVSFPPDNIGGNNLTYQWPPPSSSAIPKSTPFLEQQPLSWAQNSSSHNFGSKGMEASSLSAKPGGGMQLDSSFDPFADWPPRKASTGGSYTSSGGMSHPSLAQARLNTRSSQDIAQVSLQQQKEMNLDELFPSARPQPTSAPLKLAPPPIGSAAPLGLGKGRGRNPIHLRPTQSPKKSNSVTSNAPPPPLLDLL